MGAYYDLFTTNFLSFSTNKNGEYAKYGEYAPTKISSSTHPFSTHTHTASNYYVHINTNIYTEWAKINI